MKIYNSIADLVWHNIAFKSLEFKEKDVYPFHDCCVLASTSKNLESTMSVRIAYDYTCRFCSAVSNVFVSLDVAFRANRAASHGDFEEAKKIVLKQ